MKMRALQYLALGLGLTIGLTSCPSGGGSGGGGGSSMAITSCSLGCSTGGGDQVSCGVTDVYVNQEIRIAFTDPIRLSSVNNNTVQVVDVDNGKTPPGSFSLDSTNSRVLIYRPLLTFDSSGNPIFGLTADATYSFKVPGQTLDPSGSHVRNTDGARNQNRMLCTLVASRGIFDANPGPPNVAVYVDQVTSYDAEGNPNGWNFDVDADGAVDVWRETVITMVFDDIMNPGTLANPVTGTSTTITVLIDADGDPATTGDQLELAGEFGISIDQNALLTTVVFTPDGGLPSAGVDPTVKRKVVMNLPAAIKDLGGNSLANAGLRTFTPEVINFDPYEIVENFDTTANADDVRTGSTWSSNGALVSGSEGDTDSGIIGGGSGQLGDLRIPSGTTVVLDTDSEDFTSILDPAVFDVESIIDSPGGITVTGGVFEFASVRIEAGGILRFAGSNPARLFARGEMVVQGMIDVAGASAVVHNGTADAGGVGGAAGPGGGAGGDGGMRPDGEAFTTVGGVKGVDNPDNPSLYDDVDGKAGVGIPHPTTVAPTDNVAEGAGGLAWPHDDLLGLYFPANPADIDGMQFEPLQQCRNRASGGAGGGGGHSLTGKDGVSKLEGTFGDAVTDAPPDSPGGDSAELFATVDEDDVRALDPETGFLRGGSGGGGAGGHLHKTSTNGTNGGGGDCSVEPDLPHDPAVIHDFFSHSGAAGGGAGGGLQVEAGSRIRVNGVVDASGGAGGDNDTTSISSFASPGGGGSGGAVLLQSRIVQVQPVPGRIDIRGGAGGVGMYGSTGGLGSPGFLRMESLIPFNEAAEALNILPNPTQLDTLWDSVYGDIFTTEEWNPQPVGPSARSGAQSCWIHPAGNYFQLEFEVDGVELGWDMDVIIDGYGIQSWRGDNDVFPGQSLEDVFGNTLGSSPLVVRFQGARIAGSLPNPCNVVLYGIDSPLTPLSLTEWVPHPADLNLPSKSTEGVWVAQPNMMRFAILWDANQTGFDQILGIEAVTIRAQQD